MYEEPGAIHPQRTAICVLSSRQPSGYHIPIPRIWVEGWKDGTMSCSDDVVGTCRVDGDAASKIATGLSVPGSL